MFAVGNEIPPSVVRWHGQARVERFLRDLYDAVQAGRARQPPHLRQLPADRVPGPRLLRRLQLQRLPAPRSRPARLPRAAAARRRRQAAPAGRGRRRQPPRGARRPGAHHGDARARRVRGRRLRRGGVCLDRRVVARRAHGGRLGVRPGGRRRASRSRRWRPCRGRSPRRRSVRRPARAGRECRWWSAPTTPPTPSTTAWRRCTALTYPDVEMIVVNDGSRTRPARSRGGIPRRARHRHPQRRPERGAQRRPGPRHRRDRRLHRRRRAGRSRLAHLSGAADPARAPCVGSGGPNVVPPDDDWVAQCVARAPGGPTHVLLDDRVAEHVPGCNMAFRRDALAVDRRLQPGLPPRRRRRGHLLAAAGAWARIGFAPSALVWHHHRATVSAYWRQQVGYGEGETWLDAHHPEKFVRGQMLWRGHIYSPLPFLRSLSGRRINTGVWGTAAFPSIYNARLAAGSSTCRTRRRGCCVSLVLLVVGGAALTGRDRRHLDVAGAARRSAGGRSRSRAASSSRWHSDLHGLPAHRQRARRGRAGCCTAR